MLHDKLIPREALALARDDAELIDVGKIGGGAAGAAGGDRAADRRARARRAQSSCGSRAATRSCSAAAARRRRCCATAGIDFEVVPGVTAGIAAPAYAGIPVTFRGAASAVAFVTGHEDPAKPETAIDWPALARFPGTLVFYMGVRQLPRIAEQLIAGGRPADQPAAIVERGTFPEQRSLVATLATLPERAAAGGDPRARDHGRRRRRGAARRARVVRAPPADAAARVVVTRARAQASALAARLRELGARGRRGAGDPHRAARRRAARPARRTT